MANILFLAPEYFGYNTLLKDEMESQGHSVDFLPDTRENLYSLILKRLNLYNNKDFHQEIKRYFSLHKYDIFFVIGGRRLSIELLNYLRSEYKSVKFVMYQWDSIKNFDYRSILSSFDSVKTFDSIDSKILNIDYYPLFYKKNDVYVDTTFDFLFVGIWHSDRIEILNNIYNVATKKGMTCDFKVYYPYYMYFYLVYIKRLKIKSQFFIHKPIPLRVTQNLYRQARCIVDIAHPQQSGLTMRTIETLGNRKKLLTTNTNIVNEKFYDPSQIQVLDRDIDNLELNFIYNKYVESEDIISLEITNWVKNLLND